MRSKLSAIMLWTRDPGAPGGSGALTLPFRVKTGFPGQDEIPDQDGGSRPGRDPGPGLPGQDEIPYQGGAPGQGLRFRPGPRFRPQAGPPARLVRQKILN